MSQSEGLARGLEAVWIDYITCYDCCVMEEKKRKKNRTLSCCDVLRSVLFRSWYTRLSATQNIGLVIPQREERTSWLAYDT